MKPTVGSLFSGIGGLDLAAQWVGFETAWFVEKELFCQQILAKHWANVPIHSDVFDCHSLPHVDVIIGGFPCQPFSVAGLRQGANDERYLLPEMLRIIREVKPHAILFENVPGFPSLNDGHEFKQLLGALAEMGFDAEWGHLRASDFGAPHQRERWFCVAYAERNGDDIIRRGTIAHHTKRDSPTVKCRQHNQQLGIKPYGEKLGNTSGERCQECNVVTSERRAGFDTRQPHTNRRNGQSQSRLGGDAYGVSAGMDFVGWPARPNEPQYAYEPARVSTGTANRTARLKALGNAVVPQVAYPLMVAIYEWLTGVLP